VQRLIAQGVLGTLTLAQASGARRARSGGATATYWPGNGDQLGALDVSTVHHRRIDLVTLVLGQYVAVAPPDRARRSPLALCQGEGATRPGQSDAAQALARCAADGSQPQFDASVPAGTHHGYGVIQCRGHSFPPARASSARRSECLEACRAFARR